MPLLGLLALGLAEKPANAAPDRVLILGPTVSGGMSSLEYRLAGSGSVPAAELGTLTGLGYAVDLVDNATWASMTTAQFAAYKAIVMGDATCSVGTGNVTAAEANTAVWGPAVTGNVLTLGTDPIFHYYATRPDIAQVTYNAIKFAAAGTGTGAYIALSCYYAGSGMTGIPVPVLSPFGSFTVRGGGTLGCYNNAHIVATSPALTGLTDGILSNWSCSVHEAFDSFPGDFVPLSIAKDISGAGSLTFADGSFGVPYMMVRGAVPVLCGDGIVHSPEECDDGASNGTCGDKCSSICKLHWCGDGVVDTGEECDLGCANGAAGSACSSTCKTVSAPTPPSCALTGVIAGPPKQLQITVQDPGSGIESIMVTSSTNATVAVPPFALGEKGALVVMATKVDQSTGAHVALHITGVDGTATDCDPLVPGEPQPVTVDPPTHGAGGCNVGPAGGTAGLSGLFGALLGLALFRRRRTGAAAQK
ncbi:MAG TPA: hypothetical protein VGY54_03205 [Polyangiaceae bacterium]|nr:hypothetical protein [Polyangiaceae bacterium]